MNMINGKIDYPYNLVEEVCEEEELATTDLLGSVEYALFSLTDRERDITHLYYRDGKTLEEIGKIYGVTRERIRQVVAKAVRKLKHPSRRKYIELGVLGVIEKMKEEYAEKVAELTEKMLYLTNITDANMNTVIEKCELAKKTETEKIENFDFSVRTYNCLCRAGKRTLGDVARMSYTELNHVRNLGRKSILEIIDTLEKNGYDVRHLQGNEEAEKALGGVQG